MSVQNANLIRSELVRLLDSDFLRRSPNHLRLLRYLVVRRSANDDDTRLVLAMVTARDGDKRQAKKSSPQFVPVVKSRKLIRQRWRRFTRNSASSKTQ